MGMFDPERTLDLDALDKAVEAGHVRVRTHPTLPLKIYTYTEACTYGAHWTATTRVCRGLILHAPTGSVIAWPFPKFHNYSEHANGKPYAPPLPRDMPFQVFDKIDGSLGIVFHYDGRWHVATKGSFVSDQAIWGQEWLDRHDTDELVPGTTYLAEITFPENRIVCRYQGPGTMTLLGAYDVDGEELPLDLAALEWEAMGGPVVGAYNASSVEAIVAAAQENRHFRWIGARMTGADAEGWVIRYQNGTRVKVKLEDYVRLHGTLTRTNAHTLWEALSSGSDPADILESVPDEFADWVKEKVHDLTTSKILWVTGAQDRYHRIAHIQDRKEFALHAVDSAFRAALFRLRDGKDIQSLAWKAVEPHTDDAGYLPPTMYGGDPT